ncbi:MAG: hypothetical protein A2077_05845 [Nitrospirae bacterium GWC2_46_6]|nr:MAG: hypothetical protein A2077_05845 [Nitrospirae bacterium GWC2_46_6]OGW20759.1 MAG: hypothetical protein A2Z82_01915 [Nitrospirae bacterium GWA2_46_11]OGW23959.1 MAG: hypothetical protein A2X55_07520 [Nitrospirae bacterium GWB2_47_37]HAK87941.1 DUF512 domain-containing protein [Nitrospiraceae bacterium]HCZ11036.1 DUF512 domain-containing protein [Nitrospiraceae bacterium]
MKSNCGVEVEHIKKGSAAEKAGLRPHDCLVSINGREVNDAIDLMFYASEPDLKLRVKRGKEKITASIDAGDVSAQGLGIVLKPFKIKICRNNCIFCFVSQLPKGLRRPLYVKDEDYRMSFLYGNYITMTNLSDADKKRIVRQRLGPLYISVHSTDSEIRNKMIGNEGAADILKEIKFLAAHKIRMHAQIVLCPGYNDGKNLEKTITDLYKYYPYVMSIAVVPVGLTAHRKKAIRPVEKEDAVKAVETIHKFQARFKRKHGDNIVYAADELYIKAGMQFPALQQYGDLPQIENGVGLVPLFLHQSKKVKISDAAKKNRFVTFTGVSFYPYLSKFIDRLVKAGIDIEASVVENTFFGKSITVTGLLTGRDVMKSLSGMTKKNDILLIPDVVMREGDNIFLDDVSVKDIEDILEVRAIVIESTPKGIVEAIVKEVL